MPLWNIPEDVVQQIVAACAGDRLEWMQQQGEDESDAWSPQLSGLSHQQCLSAELLHSIVLPKVISHTGLLAPQKATDSTKLQSVYTRQ